MKGSHLTCGRVKGCVVKARESRDQGPGASLNDSRACTCTDAQPDKRSDHSSPSLEGRQA